MSRDIRSFFKPQNSKKVEETKLSRKRPKISSDEDEPSEPTAAKRSKKNEKKRVAHVLSDSEEESTPKKVTKNEKAKVEKKEEKVVSTKELFGKTPIKRVSAPKVQKKADLVKKQNDLVKKEAEYHDDEDFESVLEQLDTSAIEMEYLNSSVDGKNESKINDKNDKSKKSPQKEKRNGKEEKDKKSVKDESPSKKEKLNLSKLQKEKSPRKRKNETSTMEIESPKKVKEEKKSKEDDFIKARIEKKKQSAALYQQYLTRGGARCPGSKEIPEGAEYCLAGLRFLITGVLDSLERDEADELIAKYGGCVVHAVSKKLNYIIVGDQPGPAKITKAESLGIKQISEDDLLEMIRTRPAGKAASVVQTQHRKKEEKLAEFAESPKKEVKNEFDGKKSPKKEMKKESPKKEVKKEVLESPKKKFEEFKTRESPRKKIKTENEDVKSSPKKEKSPVKKLSKTESVSESGNKDKIKEEIPVQSFTEALVEKYRPKTMKQIIGQQDKNKSNANKLHKWLSNWHKNRSSTQSKPTWKSEDGAYFKAALLSGPPGVGKTTTVEVVCKELGFDFIEFNASDTRSKRLLHEEVAGLLSNTTMKNYFIEGNKEKPTKKHVLVMDEVDGMAGNEDRGGLQELIALIKSTSVPIVCICNDRNHPKMRTLANYVFDLRFSKPKLEAIRSAMMSLCYKENIKISREDLDQLITSTDQDVRQVINHLAMYSAGVKIESTNKDQSNKQHKDLRLGNWDVVRKVFSAEEHKKMSIHDKSDLFFHDYNIAPLFVQENYLSVVPSAPRNQHLELFAEAAESIAIGDTIENAIRRNNAWSLLPTQAMFSSVIPGTVLSGRIAAQIAFPSWLGRNSKRSKMDRLLQEVTVHSRLTTGASKEAINLDYLKPLRDKIVRPLVTQELEGVNEAIDAMNTYHLLREDLDSLVELSLWPGDRDPLQSINSKVKAAFTRSYNKNSTAYSYSASKISKKKGTSSEEGLEDNEDVDDESEEDDDNIDNDKMIKAKKPAAAKAAASTSKADASKAKSGRGRGRGRGGKAK